MPNIGVKLKTVSFGSQLENFEKYPLTMGSLFEFFILFYFIFMHIFILHVMRSAFKVTNFGISYGK